MADTFENLRRSASSKRGIFTAGIELTYRCNFECVHCYCVVGGPRRELSTEEHLQLLDDLKTAGCLSVTFTGGEALLRKDFFEIAEHAQKERFLIRLFSNALLIDGERAERIAALNPISIDISLYGASEETYRKVTGHAGWKRVTKNIDALLARGQRMLIKIPLMQENFDDLDAMTAFCVERRLPFNLDPWMTPKDDGTLGPSGHQISDEQLRAYFARFGKKVAPAMRAPEKALCTIGTGSIIISPYGDVFGCVQSKVSSGNVREQKIGEIWKNSELLRKERSLHFSEFVECRSCEFRESCFICPSISFYENGRFNGPSRYSCKVAQIRYELGQFESRPVLHQIVLPQRRQTSQPSESPPRPQRGAFLSC